MFFQYFIKQVILTNFKSKVSIIGECFWTPSKNKIYFDDFAPTPSLDQILQIIWHTACSVSFYPQYHYIGSWPDALDTLLFLLYTYTCFNSWCLVIQHTFLNMIVLWDTILHFWGHIALSFSVFILVKFYKYCCD